MIEVFIYSFLITFLFTPFGVFFTGHRDSSIIHYCKEHLFSLLVLSFLAIFLNFFFPLDKIITSISIPLSVLIIFYFRKHFLNIEFIKFCLISSFIVTLLILESEVYRPDAGLYHLPFTGILNSEKIISGISNLHSRYGHTSVIQYLSAYSNNIIFNINGVVFPSALIASSVIINFINKLYIYNLKKKFNFHFFFLLFVTIYIFYKMNRYSEYGNDAPSHFLVFFLISEIILLKNKSNISDIVNNLAICLFVILNKVMLVGIAMTSFLIISKKYIVRILKNKKFIFIGFFLVMWILKNILSTGCALYPVKFTCIDNLIWVNLSEIQKISTSGEAWSKGISDLSKKDKKKYINNEDFNKNFNWISIWSKKHLIVIIEILIPYLIFCFLGIFLIIKKKLLNNKKIDKYYLNLFLILLICNLIWFIKAPLFRYGYSFIISLVGVALSLMMLKLNLNKKKLFLFSNIIIVAGITIFTTKNLYRIYDNENKYYNYPWPKYYSMDGSNIKNKFKVRYINKEKILIPTEGYCMYIKGICNHYDFDENLKLKIYKNYKVFFLNK